MIDKIVTLQKYFRKMDLFIPPLIFGVVTWVFYELTIFLWTQLFTKRLSIWNGVSLIEMNGGNLFTSKKTRFLSPLPNTQPEISGEVAILGWAAFMVKTGIFEFFIKDFNTLDDLSFIFLS